MGGKKAHPVHRDWYWTHNDHFELWHGLDWPAVRRGRQVYTEVFAPCHPIGTLSFAHFQAFMTREEIKKLAAQYEVLDELPDMEGNPVHRPGRPTDSLPAPYPNQRSAKFANGGAEPPDLSIAHFGKSGGIDYIFALITGYNWGNGNLGIAIPPWIGDLKAGQFWNPYYKGCVIAMPPPLSDGMIDYEDGTPATTSQMAKDVCSFLRWTAEIEYDSRRVILWKMYASISVTLLLTTHFVQRNWTWIQYNRWTYRYWKKTY